MNGDGPSAVGHRLSGGDERYPVLGAAPASALSTQHSALPPLGFDFGPLRHKFVRVKATLCRACGARCDTPHARNRATGADELFPVISMAEAKFGVTCSACDVYGQVELQLEGIEPGDGERTISLPGAPVVHLQSAKRPWRKAAGR